MNYDWDFSIVSLYSNVLLKGLVITFELTLITIIAGTIIGFILGLFLNTKIRLLRGILIIFVDVVRSIPLLILILWFFYLLPSLTGLTSLSPFTTAAVALSLNLSAFIADVVRGAIKNVDMQHIEAALSIGMAKLQVQYHVIIPEVVRNIKPTLSLLYIHMFKNSSLASVIAVHELTHSANRVILETFHSLEVYTAIGLAYISIVLPVSYLLRRFENNRSAERI